MALTARQIEKLPVGKHKDGAVTGLFLRVYPNGSRSWIQRVHVAKDKQIERGLGGFPAVSPEDARKAALLNKDAFKDTGTVAVQRRSFKGIPTFREATERTIALTAKKKKWKPGGNTERLWLQVLGDNVFPKLGDRPINTLTRPEFVDIAERLMIDDHPEVAGRAWMYSRAVLAWAMDHAHISNNFLLGKSPTTDADRTRGNHPAVPWRNVAAALELVDGTSASKAVKACLRFQVLTAVRPGEARGARWAEIDLDEKTWTIPAERMKTGQEHRVPLSDAAVAVLSEARRLDDGSGLVFPSRGHEIADRTTTKLLSHNAVGGVPHGFRSTFRDWCGDTGKAYDVAEAALAHVRGGTEGAYFRSDLFERRATLMQQWANYLTGKDARERQGERDYKEVRMIGMGAGGLLVGIGAGMASATRPLLGPTFPSPERPALTNALPRIRGFSIHLTGVESSQKSIRSRPASTILRRRPLRLDCRRHRFALFVNRDLVFAIVWHDGRRRGGEEGHLPGASGRDTSVRLPLVSVLEGTRPVLTCVSLSGHWTGLHGRSRFSTHKNRPRPCRVPSLRLHPRCCIPERMIVNQDQAAYPVRPDRSTVQRIRSAQCPIRTT